MKLAHLLALAAALAAPAHAVDVYKWTDRQGVVHYGDRPASGAAAATVNVPDDHPGADDAARAQRRLEIAREYYQRQAVHDRPQPTQAQGRQPAAASDCAAAWQRYEAAQACFDSHRAASGKGVTDAGLARCTEVRQPSCAR
jgi:hypothetical protein